MSPSANAVRAAARILSRLRSAAARRVGNALLSVITLLRSGITPRGRWAALASLRRARAFTPTQVDNLSGIGLLLVDSLSGNGAGAAGQPPSTSATQYRGASPCLTHVPEG
ncbi:hypothetical protein Sm713_62890 [Streptomyces sp. TS71-3]|nr:hypothetical protein Sm713_62890 [Streptomyces sp. TS71-3]